MSNFHESFDHGIGQLGNHWGNINTSVAGQVTLTGNSGMMQWASGASAGNGYGHYQVTLSMQGNKQGPAALLWPGNDKWPGQEIDFAEINQGFVYGTAHHKTSSGGDGYRTTIFNGIDESKPHTYFVDWTPGKLVFGVDGHAYGTVTQNVGKDFAHGGVDEVFGALNINAGTSITVYDMQHTDWAF